MLTHRVIRSDFWSFLVTWGTVLALTIGITWCAESGAKERRIEERIERQRADAATQLYVEKRAGSPGADQHERSVAHKYIGKGLIDPYATIQLYPHTQTTWIPLLRDLEPYWEWLRVRDGDFASADLMFDDGRTIRCSEPGECPGGAKYVRFSSKREAFITLYSIPLRSLTQLPSGRLLAYTPPAQRDEVWAEGTLIELTSDVLRLRVGPTILTLSHDRETKVTSGDWTVSIRDLRPGDPVLVQCRRWPVNRVVATHITRHQVLEDDRLPKSLPSPKRPKPNPRAIPPTRDSA